MNSEDQNKPEANTPKVEVTPRVMDVQPPARSTEELSEASTPSELEANEMAQPVVEVPTSVAPAPTEPELEPSGETSETGDESSPQPDEATEQPATNAMAISAKPEKIKSKAPIGAIILAIVVALVLVGIAIFVYMKTQDDTTTTQDSSTNTTSDTTTTVNGTDIDQTTQEIDSTLGTLDNTSDFSSDSLSDTSLGL